MGTVLREAREAQGLTLKALARKIRTIHRAEIGTTTIRQVEQEIVPNPGLKTIELICRGLELPPLEILALGLDDPPPENMQRFSQSRLAALSEVYEALPPQRKVLWDEVLDMVFDRMRKG